MHFLAPLWGLGFLALGAILAFYLLKRRYKDFPVPSTFLWRKARQDSSASHPFQRLRKNALLPLHLLLAHVIEFPPSHRRAVRKSHNAYAASSRLTCQNQF